MRRISPLLLAGLALALPAPSAAYMYDYKVEFIGTIGYTWSEGIDVSNFVIGEPPDPTYTINRLNIESGRSYGAAVELLVTPEVALGFNWGRQEGRLTARTVTPAVGSHDITDMIVDNYHGTVTIHFPDPWRSSTPFFLFGLGGTKYFFDDVNGQKMEGDTRFSSTWGFGFKFHSDGPLGLRLMGRWTPTYIKSEPNGYWCSYYGCWSSSKLDYSHQFEVSGSLMLRF